MALPVNDTEQGYDYPARVRWSLAQDDESSYQEAAEFLNFNNIDMVCLQHEYGIFGGPAGSHILHLLRGLKMPVVTTLHTVLREPNPDQLTVMQEIAELSDRLIVMSHLSSQFLQEIFKVPGSKIDMVPHGVPDLPFLDPNFYKDRFGVEGKAVLLTFGLLSPNKGIENVIQAMPQILAKHENVVYLVAGATHPHVLRRDGDKYRASLQALAKEVGVESRVIFHDRFVSPEEMAEFIGAADIYITPYRHEAQVVSGTLAYALGAGKAIISTPYWHAVELLDEGRGALVPFQDPNAIAQKAIELLATPALRHAMRKRAYLFARDMVWKKAAQGYMGSFAQVRSDRLETPRVQFSARNTQKSLNQLPDLKLDHVNALTDDTGMLQHAIFTIPNRAEGYTTDDNARALIFTVLLEQRDIDPLNIDRLSIHRKPIQESRLAFPVLGISGARLQRKEETIPEFYGLRPPLAGRPRLGGFPRPRFVGSRNSSGSIQESGIERRRRSLVRVLGAGGGRVPQPSSVRLRSARNAGVSAFVSGRPRCPARTAGACSKIARDVRVDQPSRLEVV